MIELWRPVTGYEGYYEVSNLGSVRSLAYGKIRKLSPVLDSTGYPTVKLARGGLGVRFKIHRLVCRAFHGEPMPGQQAAHLDGVRDNARADNLIWATQSENEEHKRAHGTKMSGSSHVMAKLSENQVAEIRERVASGETQTAVRTDYGISSGHISEIVTGKKWTEGESAVGATSAETPALSSPRRG